MSPQHHTVLAIIIGMSLIRVGEYRLHRANARFLRNHGGSETGTGWMSAFYAIEGVALGIMVLECLLLPKMDLPIGQRFVGLSCVGLGAMLRIWARRTLGRTWSLYLIYITDIPKVNDGPYRYFAHPEYLSRFLEMFGFSLIFGCYYGFGIYLAGAMMILPQILVLELRQLRQHAAPPNE